MTAPDVFFRERLYTGRRVVKCHLRRITLAVLIPYPIILLWLFSTFDPPTFEAIGYPYHDPQNPWIVLTGIALALLPVAWLPLRLRRPGVIMVWMMYVLAYVPAQVIPIMGTNLDAVDLLSLQGVLLAGFMVLVLADRLPPVDLSRVNVTKVAFWGGFCAVYVAFTVALLWYMGVPTALPSFGDVYDVRGTFIDRLAEVPGAIGYIYSWQGQVLNPFLICYAIARRFYLPGVVGVIGQLYLYGMSGEKSVLFTAALLVGVFLTMWVAHSMVVPMIAVGASALVVGSIVFDSLLNTSWFLGLFVHRLTVIPGQLTGLYFEFFSSNPKAMLGYSVLSPLFDYPYDTTIPLLIGREMAHSPEMIANANIWADGYANFGFGGVVLVSMIAGTVIWLFNSLSLGHKFLLGTLLAAGVAFTWTNISVFTSLLTHGIFLTFVLLWSVPPWRPATVQEA